MFFDAFAESMISLKNIFNFIYFFSSFKYFLLEDPRYFSADDCLLNAMGKFRTHYVTRFPLKLHHAQHCSQILIYYYLFLFFFLLSQGRANCQKDVTDALTVEEFVHLEGQLKECWTFGLNHNSRFPHILNSDFLEIVRGR